MSLVLSGGRVVLPDRVLDRASIAIDDAGRIAEIVAAPVPRGNGVDWHDMAGRIIVPGFVDVHVHGVDGTDTLATVDAVRTLAAVLPRYGVTAFCPTTIACSPAALRRLLGEIRAARQLPAEGHAAVLPAHLESNFINPDYRGAQPASCLRLPTDETFDVDGGGVPFSGQAILDEIAAARTEVGIVTVASELPGVLDLVAALSMAGHIVSLGHSAATYEQARQGIEAGARHGTHLFNRMPPFGHRAPGLVGAIFDSPSVRAEIVCDGYHVHPVVMKTAIAALGVDRAMAITDGTAGSGLPVGSVVALGTQTITVRSEAAFLADGTLSGSTLTMDGAFRRLIQQCGLSLTAAAKLCATTPATQLGLDDRGRIAPGLRADLAILDHDLRPVRTFVAGIAWAG